MNRTAIRHLHAIRLLVTGVMLAALLIACGQPDPTLNNPQPVGQSGDSPGGRILFSAQGNIQLWDNGNTRRVTNVGDGFEAQSPTWAPDGQRFAYSSVERDQAFSDIIVADLDGKTLRQVTNNSPGGDPFTMEFVCNANWAADPTWDRSGERIIWTSDRGGWEYDSCEQRLSDPMFLWYSETWAADPYILSASVNLALPQEGPTLSSDGQKAAMVVRQEVTQALRHPQIWTLDLNSGETEVIVNHPEGAYDPAWSPDDKYIAYIQRDENRNDVWVAPLNGNDPYRLTGVGDAVSPTWSPDGKFLAFFRAVDGKFEAWSVQVTVEANGNLAASEPRRLFTSDGIDAPSGMSWIN